MVHEGFVLAVCRALGVPALFLGALSLPGLPEHLTGGWFAGPGLTELGKIRMQRN